MPKKRRSITRSATAPAVARRYPLRKGTPVTILTATSRTLRGKINYHFNHIRVLHVTNVQVLG